MKINISGFKELIGLNHGLISLILVSVFFFSPLPVLSLDKDNKSVNNNSRAPVLIEATLCEDMKDGLPLNRAILFSMEKGKVFCFSIFDNINERTTIFHKWYFRDKLIYRNKLSLKPPRWSTYSSIKLRDTDRGPWRVDIVNQENYIYQTLRFSIAD
jgi:hypothetical protein